MGNKLTRVQQQKHFAASVIEEVANGATVAKTLEKLGKPMSAPTFRKTVLHDPELLRQWEAAKDMRAHALFDQAVDLTNQLKDGQWKKDDASMVRALDRAITAFFYAAARLSPREYGERASPNPIVPIQIITSLNLGQDGKPTAGQDSVYQLKAEVVDAAFEPSGAAKPLGG